MKRIILKWPYLSKILPIGSNTLILSFLKRITKQNKYYIFREVLFEKGRATISTTTTCPAFPFEFQFSPRAIAWSKSFTEVNRGTFSDKRRNFTLFPCVAILCKGAIPAWFEANRTKLRGNCAFRENSHARKLGEITILFAVSAKKMLTPLFRKKMSVSDNLIAHITNFLRIVLTRQYVIVSDLSFLKPFGVNIFIRGTSW